MKGNVWLAGYIVFTALLLGGSGFFLVKNRGAFEERFDGWDALKGKISRLEKEVPFPSEENEASLRSEVESYDGKVKSLYQSLSRYQKPLRQDLSDSEFTNQILKGKVSDFLKLASEKKMELEKRDDFYMGFDAYRTTFPRPEVVSALNYQLEAVEHLLNSLAESGVDRLNFLTREQLPGEEQTADAVAATGIVKGEVVQKYPITLGFVADHRDFQEFVNRIANDKDYFFILRVLRVDNSSPGGPSFETEGGLGQSAWLKPDGIEATQTEMEEMGMGTLPYDEFSKKAIEAGWQQKRQDARIIFGQEKLEVFTVIDLVRFLSPDEVDEGSGEGKEPEVDSKKNGR